jgi:hypothetical protein
MAKSETRDDSIRPGDYVRCKDDESVRGLAIGRVRHAPEFVTITTGNLLRMRDSELLKDPLQPVEFTHRDETERTVVQLGPGGHGVVVKVVDLASNLDAEAIEIDVLRDVVAALSRIEKSPRVLSRAISYLWARYAKIDGSESTPSGR